MQRRERRHKLQIYYDILSAIDQEAIFEDGAKPTRVQYISKVSYDRLVHYLKELEVKKMIEKGDSISLTEKGRKFLKDYEELKNLTERMGLQ